MAPQPKADWGESEPVTGTGRALVRGPDSAHRRSHESQRGILCATGALEESRTELKVLQKTKKIQMGKRKKLNRSRKDPNRCSSAGQAQEWDGASKCLSGSAVRCPRGSAAGMGQKVHILEKGKHQAGGKVWATL